MFITAVETQGRDDNGLGAEFAENYRIEYWRPSIATWARYRTGNGTTVSYLQIFLIFISSGYQYSMKLREDG